MALSVKCWSIEEIRSEIPRLALIYWGRNGQGRLLWPVTDRGLTSGVFNPTIADYAPYSHAYKFCFNFDNTFYANRSIPASCWFWWNAYHLIILQIVHKRVSLLNLGFFHPIEKKRFLNLLYGMILHPLLPHFRSVYCSRWSLSVRKACYRGNYQSLRLCPLEVMWLAWGTL